MRVILIQHVLLLDYNTPRALVGLLLEHLESLLLFLWTYCKVSYKGIDICKSFDGLIVR